MQTQIGQPMISVMMPVYNTERFLKESIDSILCQTEQDFELIIVNDGSTDSSEDIILSYRDHRIRYEKQENKGRAAARQLALSLCRGEFITFQDADDIALPTRLEELRKGYISPSVGLVHSDMLLINDTGQPIGYWQAENISKENMLRFFLRIGTPFNNPSAMIRREFLANFYYDTALGAGEDTDMIFRIGKQMHSFHVSKPLLLYRRHAENINKHRGDEGYERFAKHIRKMIQAHTLQELIPEVDWNCGQEEINRSRALAILALLLGRRGMGPDAQQFLEQSIEYVRTYPTEKFPQAILALMQGNFINAINMLLEIHPADHIVNNYLGEAFSICGKPDKALQYFLKSIQLRPGYSEPINNIKCLGRILNLNILDTSWRNIKKQI